MELDRVLSYVDHDPFQQESKARVVPSRGDTHFETSMVRYFVSDAWDEQGMGLGEILCMEGWKLSKVIVTTTLDTLASGWT